MGILPALLYTGLEACAFASLFSKQAYVQGLPRGIDEHCWISLTHYLMETLTFLKSWQLNRQLRELSPIA